MGIVIPAVLTIALALVVTGVALIYFPLGLIAAGAALVALVVAHERGAE